MKSSRYIGSEQWRKVMNLMAGDMLEMGRILMPEAVKVDFADFHAEVAELCQDITLRHVNFIAARGHAKSTLIARFLPLWHIFLEDHYYGRKRTRKFVVLCSRTQDLAKAHLAAIVATIERSKAFRDHFGDWSDFRQRNKHMLELRDETLLLCKGMGQQYVGLNWKGLRPTLAINDDLEDKTNTITDEALQNNFRWLIGDVEPAVDPQIGRVVVIGTPKHRNCIIERLDREESGYVSRRYPAILNENTPEERALWEEWKPLADLKKDRRRARSNGEEPEWVQEMLCKVTSDKGDFSNINYWEGRVLFDAWWNVYLEVTHVGGKETKGDLDLMRSFDVPLIIPVNTYLGSDPAISQSDRADDAVVCVTGYDRQARTWSIDLTAAKGIPVDDQVAFIIRDALAYNVRNAAIEGVAFQQVIHQNLERFLRYRQGEAINLVRGKYRALTGEEKFPRDLRMFIPGMYNKHQPKKAKKGDNSRLGEMQPDFSAGKIYLRARHTKLRDEALDYPHGEDNCLDALYYARLKNYKPTHTPDMLSPKKERRIPVDGRSLARRRREREYDWRMP